MAIAGLLVAAPLSSGAAGLLSGSLTGGSRGLASTATSAAAPVTNALPGAASGSGIAGVGVPTAGSYVPPLNDVGNPHGEGTVATATLGGQIIPVPAGAPSVVPANNEVVVGRSLGELQTSTGLLHGHVTILSLFGSEILGVDSKPGQGPQSFLATPGNQATLTSICTQTAQALCLNAVKATSLTTNSASVNHFEAAGVGLGGVTADLVYSDGNITVDPVGGCETTFGQSHGANANLALAPLAQAVDSISGATTCRDPNKNQAPASLSQVVKLLGLPLGVPLVSPNPGCSSGGSPTSVPFSIDANGIPTNAPSSLPGGGNTAGVPNTDAGVPLLLPVICNADDNSGPGSARQDSIPYTVREALTAQVLALLPGAAVAKVTLASSQASAAAAPCPTPVVAPVPTGCPPPTTTSTTTPTTTSTTTPTTTSTTTPTTTSTTTPTTTSTTTPTTSTSTTSTSTSTTPPDTTSTTPPDTTSTTPPNTTSTTTPTTGTTPRVTTTSARLPFTGLDVLWLVLGGVAMLAAGTTLRRFDSRRRPPE